MNSFLKFIPGLASEAKETVTKAISSFNKEDQTYFFRENLNKSQVLEKLESSYAVDISDGLKTVLAWLILGKDVKDFIPGIVSLIPSESGEIRRYCYIVIQEIACSQKENLDQLLMAISPLHKNIVTPKSVQKADSLKTLSSIGIPETTQLLISTLHKMVNDKSGYPKKILLNTFLKLHQNFNPNDIEKKQQQYKELENEQICEIIAPLLKDRPFVAGTAIRVYSQLNQDPKMEWMHKIFFNICKNLSLYNQYDTVYILQLLQRYSLLYFSHLQQVTNKDKENQQKQQIKEESQDLQQLIISCEKLLISSHPSIILEVGNIIMQFSNEKENIFKKYIKALLRFISISSESKIVILLKLEEIAKKYPTSLRKYYAKFFIIQLEKIYCKKKKIQILSLLAYPGNCNNIIQELSYYTRCNQDQVATEAIYVLGQLAQQNDSFAQNCTKSLLELLKESSQKFIDPVIFTLINIIGKQIQRNLPILVFCMKKMQQLKSSNAKVKLLKNLILVCKDIPTMTAEYLRKLVVGFKDEKVEVRSMILQLAYQLLLELKGIKEEKQDQEFQNQVISLFKYVLTLSLYDNDITLRDMGRFIKNIVFNNEGLKDKQVLGADNQNILSNIQKNKAENSLINEINNNKSSQQNDDCETQYEQIFDPSNIMENNSIQQNNLFRIGTLSHMMNQRLQNYYELPFEHEQCQHTTHNLRVQEQINKTQENYKVIEQQQTVAEREIQKQEQQIQESNNTVIVNKQQSKPVQVQNIEEEEKNNNNIQQKIPKEQKLQNLEKDLDDFFS